MNSLKKICPIALALMMVFAIAGCKPIGMSDGAYNSGKAAIEVVDDYLSGSLTSFEAVDELNDIEVKMEKYTTGNDFDVRVDVLCVTTDILSGESLDSHFRELKSDLGE